MRENADQSLTPVPFGLQISITAVNLSTHSFHNLLVSYLIYLTDEADQVKYLLVCLFKNILSAAEFLQKSKEVQALLICADDVYLLV